ncbi:hypothetical protein AnigIFM56816_003785 [Aspergillus niger]|nr:hypothetical protein AnigIFM56816_003785 [Aspergillus niger]
MEEALATMVQEVREDLFIDDKMRFAQELAELQTKLLQVPLNWFMGVFTMQLPTFKMPFWLRPVEKYPQSSKTRYAVVLLSLPPTVA